MKKVKAEGLSVDEAVERLDETEQSYMEEYKDGDCATYQECLCGNETSGV